MTLELETGNRIEPEAAVCSVGVPVGRERLGVGKTA